MNELIKIVKSLDNFEEIKKEVLEIVEKFGNDSNQIVCQGLSEDSDDWNTGGGRIKLLEEQKEEEYKYLNPLLRGTCLSKIIEENNCFRTRIMIMPSHRCYSVHHDPTARLHIPIVTSSQAWMIWPYHNTCYKMRTGLLYLADTTKPHTFINGGDDIRIHVVMNVNTYKE